jgi:ADP-ribosylation factor GTPase-activating protein 1
MDAFKGPELARMAAGGNKPWKAFFDAHSSNKLEGRTFEDSTIQERYDSEAGEEWKDRLTANIEGKEYVAGEKSKKTAPARTLPSKSAVGGVGSRSGTPLGKSVSNSSAAAAGGGSLGSRSASPSLGTATVSKKSQNEAYFARMGAENASRPDDLPPNQGGKFSGFGSDWPPKEQQKGGAGGIPGADEFQKDPVAALTKGFGWLSSTVTKGAQAGFQKVCILPRASIVSSSRVWLTSRIAFRSRSRTTSPNSSNINRQHSLHNLPTRLTRRHRRLQSFRRRRRVPTSAPTRW